MSLVELEIVELSEDALQEVNAIERVSQDRPWSQSSFRRELHVSFSKILGARSLEDQRLFGYLVFWHVSDEIHVLNIAVHPDARRRGIGRQLVEASVSIGRNLQATVMYLEVRASNHAAILLYKSLGFTVVQTRENYYPDNLEDALVMECPLDSVAATD